MHFLGSARETNANGISLLERMLLKQKQIKSNQIGMLILVVAQTRETERVKLDLILLDLTRIDTKDITRTVKIVFF